MLSSPEVNLIENTLERQFSHFSCAYISCAVEHGILIGGVKMFYLLTGCTDGINLSVVQMCRAGQHHAHCKSDCQSTWWTCTGIFGLLMSNETNRLFENIANILYQNP